MTRKSHSGQANEQVVNGKITESQIVVELRQDGDQVRLCVEDRGPGIPLEHHEKIFQKFYRVDDSLTAPQPGSGLGLSISRRLLRDLGGDLVYQERKGGGSCFIAILS